MELEVRELDAASRNKYLTRIESYQAELARLEKDFNTKKSACDGGREELLGDQGVEDFYDQKQLLINNSEKLERGIKRLDLGYQIAVETEQIGNNILTDLNQQRETIQKTRNRVSSTFSYCKFIAIYNLFCHSFQLRETDEELGRSGRMLNRMLARIVQNRLIFLGIILALVIVVILVLYIRFRKSS